MARISRRRFCTTLAAGAAGLSGCRLGTTDPPISGTARITARPGVAPTTPMPAGIYDLQVGGVDRFCWMIVPAGYNPSQAWPLTLFFRGAITPARDYMDSFQPLADEFGIVVLAPEASSRTWDMLLGGFGPDVDFINMALHVAFQTVHIDPARLCSSGFSDGGSYSLSLGLTNGDVLARIAAYSPGFIQADAERGRPEFFITHGNADAVLPADGSRYLTSQLQAAGYQVEYREFDGPHAVKLSLARESFEWMVRPAASAGR